ncbi:MAG: hypothetical protein WAT12_09105 [Candidatus Nitrotoga sp.]
MLSTYFRRIQLSINISYVIQLTLFLACIIYTPHSIASSETTRSEGSSTVAPSPKIAFTVGELISLFAAVVLLLMLFHTRQYLKTCKVDGEKKSLLGFFLYFIEGNFITILVTAFLMGAAHFSMALILGHEIEGVMIAVALINPIETLYHRLSGLPTTIEKTVMDTIPKSLDDKKFFVTGTPHTSNVKKMLQFIRDHEVLEVSLNGISIFCFKSSAKEYAELCEHFLKDATLIESMTDMDLDKALPLFEDVDGNVMKWIRKVNQKKENEISGKEINVHRILVLTQERRIFLEAIETLIKDPKDQSARLIVENYSRLPVSGSMNTVRNVDRFINSAKSGLINFKRYYCKPMREVDTSVPVGAKFNILAKESKEIGCEYQYLNKDKPLCAFHNNSSRGEFIMFNRKYLVRFNSESELLEVVIGEMLEEFSEIFNASGQEYLLSLEQNGSFTDLQLPLKPMVEGV